MAVSLKMGTTENVTTYTTESIISPSSSSGQWALLSDEQKERANHVSFVLFLVATALCLPLTVCNVAVFLQRDMRSATAVYVIGLSVAQIVYVVSSTAYAVAREVLPSPTEDLAFWVIRLYVMIYCGIVARRGSYVVMTLVSLERMYAIARPLHVKDFFLSRRPVISMTSAYVITAVWHVYVLAKYEIGAVASDDDPLTGRVVYTALPSTLYLQHKDINDAFSVAAKVLLTYVALLLQIALNILTVLCLRRHNVGAAAASSQCVTQASEAKEAWRRRRERQLTVTILAATAGYVLLSLPATLHNLVTTLVPEIYGGFGKYKNLHSVLEYVALDLTILSCGIDFLCFLMLSSNYRAALFRMVGHKTSSRGPPDQVTETQTDVE